MSQSNDAPPDATELIQAIAPPPGEVAPPRKSDQAMHGVLTFLKSGLVITVTLIVFNWGNGQFRLEDKLGKVKTEVWIGLLTTIATTYWSWYSDREQEKMKQAKALAASNAASIKAISEVFEKLVKKLENRLDSVMLQLAAIRQSQGEAQDAIAGLDKEGRDLDEKIDKYRYDVLRERIEIHKIFYAEIRDIHAAVNYLRGLSHSASHPTIKSFDESLMQVASQLGEASKSLEEEKRHE